MRRATTPLHEFTLPFDSSTVFRFLLTYTQSDKVILEKTENDMTVNGNVWSVELTQEEANLFSEGYASAQIRVLTMGGEALASNPMQIYVGKVYNDEVLV